MPRLTTAHGAAVPHGTEPLLDIPKRPPRGWHPRGRRPRASSHRLGPDQPACVLPLGFQLSGPLQMGRGRAGAGEAEGGPPAPGEWATGVQHGVLSLSGVGEAVTVALSRNTEYG